MNKEENTRFIKKIESLVKPEDVTTISFLSSFSKSLPKKTQHKFMLSGKKKVPYMGFIVDPYSLFLSYEISNTSVAQKMLPDGYELAETSIFKNDTKIPMAIASVFTARTSGFIGIRAEFYVIARNKETGMLSWIICDYETNTNSYDPKNGFCGYTCDPAVFTTSPFGELIVNIKNCTKNKEFIVSVDLEKGNSRQLDESLWIEGNLIVDYGGEVKSDFSEPFSLIFDTRMVKEAVNIPLEHVSIKSNSYLGSIIDPFKPVNALIFPYSQHFVIKQDLKKYGIKNQKDLDLQINSFLDRNGFKVMAGDDIKKPIYGMAL
ncbi:MAG: hypothetical protein GF317_11935, partial [Candidatus Lokiarchaeota archaeon]|nr:hypothetical protein [Candidatus Lokiarchaeota archaeon]MBD3200357.1 hypothetical protein [Candidatus Lokiarchaeota archaeon]